MDNIWKTKEAQRLLAEKDRVEALGRTRAGQRLTELAREQDLAGALERGDTEAMQQALRKLLSTGEGQTLLTELQTLMR